MYIHWDSVKYKPIHIPVAFELEMGDNKNSVLTTVDDDAVTCRVKGQFYNEMAKVNK